MLQNIRSNLQGTAAKVIIAIICIPFVLFGVESLIGGGGSNKVAEINGEKITNQELSEAIFLQKRQMMAQMGQNINPAMLEDERLKEPALQSLIDRKVLLQAADDLGMAVSTQQINQMIVNNPQFQENGQFSNERFQQVLVGAGFNTDVFMRLYASDMLVAQLSGGIVNSGFVTPEELAVNAMFTQQTRDIRFITLSSVETAKSVSASNEELQAFYQANKDLFQSKERVSLQYLELKRSDFIKDVSDDELKEAFDNELANTESSEQREVSHILIEINDKRDEVAAMALANELKLEIDSGADFSKLAQMHSDDFGSRDNGGSLGVLDAEAFPVEFVVAASALETQQVSAAVKSEAGVHLIKLTALSKTDAPVFSDRKAALTQELQLAKAEPEFWQAVDELKDLSFNAADLNDPAKDMDLTVKSGAFFTRSGGEGVFANAQVVAAAYSEDVLIDGQNSDVIELADDHVIVVRINEHNPAALIAFTEVSGDVKAAVIQDKADVLLKDAVESLTQQLQKGADVEKLAKAQGYNWQLMLAAMRSAQVAPADRQVINAAFALPVAAINQRAIDSIKLASGDYAVLAVDNVIDGIVGEMPEQQMQATANYLSRARSSELFKVVQSQLNAEADIERL